MEIFKILIIVGFIFVGLHLLGMLCSRKYRMYFVNHAQTHDSAWKNLYSSAKDRDTTNG